MPKLKTNKAASKRYSYTASGKVKRTTAKKTQISYKNKKTKNVKKTKCLCR